MYKIIYDILSLKGPKCVFTDIQTQKNTHRQTEMGKLNQSWKLFS